MRRRESCLIDADVIYAFLDPSDWLHEPARRVMKVVERGGVDAYVTPITVLELAVVVKRDISEDAMLKLYEELKSLGLKFLQVDEDTVREAFNYMKMGMGIFDAFHAATAKTHKLTIISTDHKYDQAGLKRIDPREF